MNGEEPGWTSDKSSRRRAIAKSYRILLLVGDDLGDFVPGAQDTPENRLKLVAKYRSQWGRGWFLLPNPLSGTWESALYGYNSSMTDAEILEKKLTAVRYFGEPAEQTADPLDSSIVPDLTVTFRGDKCSYEGPEKVYTGWLIVGLSVEEKKFTSYGLFMATLNPDKTMQDLKNWPSLEQPPWVHRVVAKTVTPGDPTSLSVLVTEGPLYLVCFGFNPDTIIGVLGPIEVVR